MLKKRIKWEKWNSPFDVEDDEDDEDTDNWKNKNVKKDTHINQMIIGPMGIIPITEHGNPSKLYNFWMMHTNFNLSEPVCNTLNKVDGIEGLDVFTRYRARLAFGKLFEEEAIQEEIEKVLCVNDDTQKPNQTPVQQPKNHLDAIKQQMQAKYKHWFIAITEKEEIKLFGNDSKEVVEKKLLEYPNAQICKSW